MLSARAILVSFQSTVLTVALAGCPYDPSGHYQGKVMSRFEALSEADKAPFGETYDDVDVKSLERDLFEVTFAKCAFKVKLPRNSSESQWELAERTKCTVEEGEVSITTGHMTILKGEPEVSVTFDGLTADERFKVSFFTFGAKRLPD